MNPTLAGIQVHAMMLEEVLNVFVRQDTKELIVKVYRMINFRIYFSARSHCEPNPCRNSGACYNDGASFKCVCRIGYKGLHCEGIQTSFFIVASD